ARAGNGTRPGARPAAHARRLGRRRPVRTGSSRIDLPAADGIGACCAPAARRGHRGADSGAGRRPHRSGRFPHGGAGGGGRPVDRAHPRGEEPHTGAAVTREATLIAGDGIGPEITQVTLQVLDALGVAFDWDEQYGGMSAVEQAGTPLPDATVDSIRRTGLALKGPLTTPVGDGYRSVNVALRQEFELYANVRPVKSIVPGGCYPDVDLVIIRENTEGMYVGFDRAFKVGNDPKALAQATSVMTRDGCRRIVRYAFEYARRHDRRKVTVVHKANILKATSGLFLETARMIAQEYEGQIASDEKIVDNAAMQLVINPAQFDVIVTTNLFGDILSDEASGLVGGLVRALRGADRGDRTGRSLCVVCEIGREKGVTYRTSRGGGHYPARCGVCNPHPQVGGTGVSDDRPDSGRRGGRRLVPADLSHRAEDGIRMAQIAASIGLAMAVGVMPLAGQTSLSIYSDGRVVVRRTLPQ